jgi:PHD/YefM family antitoxin component YafN of YafNO toxin-antitoxin module
MHKDRRAVMGTVETRKRIHSTIDEMPLEKLDAVLSFLEDLERSSEDETAMLMSDPGFMGDYKEAKEDIRTGKTVRLKAIRRDV